MLRFMLEIFPTLSPAVTSCRLNLLLFLMARIAVMADSFPPGSWKDCWLFVCHLVGYKRSGARLLVLMFFTRVCFTTRSGAGPGVSVRPRYKNRRSTSAFVQVATHRPETIQGGKHNIRRPLHLQQQLPSGLHRGFGLTLNDSLANHLTWTDASGTGKPWCWKRSIGCVPRDQWCNRDGGSLQWPRRGSVSRSMWGCQTTCSATSPQFAMQSWNSPLLVGNDATDPVWNGRLVIKSWVESVEDPQRFCRNQIPGIHPGAYQRGKIRVYLRYGYSHRRCVWCIRWG